MLSLTLLMGNIIFSQVQKQKKLSKPYFISPSIDSLSLENFLNHDALKMTDPKQKIVRFTAGVSCYYCEGKITDVEIFTIEGNRVSANKTLLNDINNFKDKLMVLSIGDVEYIDDKGY